MVSPDSFRVPQSEEHRQRSLKIKEIESLRQQFLQLQQTRSDLKQKNDHYKQNKQYLESVKDAVPEQYGEIDELIVRHQILKQTNTDLTESNRKVSEGNNGRNKLCCCMQKLIFCSSLLFPLLPR
jgi:predicted transcriptional regulator